MFDLTTSDIKRGSDSVSHFTDEAVFEPLVIVYSLFWTLIMQKLLRRLVRCYNSDKETRGTPT